MRRSLLVWTSFVILVAGATACAPQDPIAEVHQQRARWRVDLLSWAAGEDGSLALSTRLTGPPRSSLEQLTIRIAMLDALEQPIETAWWTFDLTAIERGGPEDVLFRIPAPESAVEVEGLILESVLNPTPEDVPHIRELRGVGQAG
jgi:hypothetical protein